MSNDLSFLMRVLAYAVLPVAALFIGVFLLLACAAGVM